MLVPLGMRFRLLLADGSDGDEGFLAARNGALAPVFAVLARGVETGELPRAANLGWLGMVLAALLMTAVRAADAGLIEPAEAADLVANAFMDGFAGG